MINGGRGDRGRWARNTKRLRSIARNYQTWKTAARDFVKIHEDTLPPAVVEQAFGRAVAEKVGAARLDSEVAIRQIIDQIQTDGPAPEKWFALASQLNIQGYTQLAQASIDAAWKDSPGQIPLSVRTVVVLLTYRCDRSCPPCWCTHTPGNREITIRELTAEQFVKVLTRSTVLKSAYLTFSGGEVFLRRDLEDILQAVEENGQSFTLNTNGSFPDRLDKLLANPHIRSGLKRILISLDGTKEIHDQIRGEGSFDLLAESVRIAGGHGIPVRSQTVVQAANKEQLACIAEASRRLGCVSHGFNFEQQGLRQTRFGPLAFDKVLSNKALIYHCCEEIYTGVGCSSGTERLEIQPDGRVLPCAMAVLDELRYLSLGELRNYDFDFDRLWVSEQACKARAEVRSCPGCANPSWR